MTTPRQRRKACPCPGHGEIRLLGEARRPTLIRARAALRQLPRPARVKKALKGTLSALLSLRYSTPARAGKSRARGSQKQPPPPGGGRGAAQASSKPRCLISRAPIGSQSEQNGRRSVESSVFTLNTLTRRQKSSRVFVPSQRLLLNGAGSGQRVGSGSRQTSTAGIPPRCGIPSHTCSQRPCPPWPARAWSPKSA